MDSIHNLQELETFLKVFTKNYTVEEEPLLLECWWEPLSALSEQMHALATLAKEVEIQLERLEDNETQNKNL